MLNSAFSSLYTWEFKKLIRKGEIILPNCVEYPIVFAGAARSRVTTTTINPAYTPTEISKQLNLAGCSHIVTNAFLLPAIQETARLMDELDEPLEIILTDARVDGCLNVYDMIQTDAYENVSAPLVNVDDDIRCF